MKTDTAIHHIQVRKDDFTPSKPWCADIHWQDGTVWKSWSYAFSTRKNLLRHIEAVKPDVEVRLS